MKAQQLCFNLGAQVKTEERLPYWNPCGRCGILFRAARLDAHTCPECRVSKTEKPRVEPQWWLDILKGE